MGCPNGHEGGIFCCEDHVNQVMASFYERYKSWSPEQDPLIPVTLDQWRMYKKLMEEENDGKG